MAGSRKVYAPEFKLAAVKMVTRIAANSVEFRSLWGRLTAVVF